ncbi:MAG: hypothetical protein KJ042_10260 [Deltaproteobacteria bacterium]|nr:hypothetical protein [Deltaproteobacteria bacterium]
MRQLTPVAPRVLLVPGPAGADRFEAPMDRLAPLANGASGEIALYRDALAPNGFADRRDGFLSSLRWYARLVRFVWRGRDRIDLVHFHETPGPAVCGLLRTARRFMPRVRFTQRIAFIPVTSGSLSRRLFAHAVVVETLDALDRVRVHAPGIAAYRLPPPVASDGEPPSRDEIPARLGLHPGAFHLLFDGPIERGNVLEHLARIVPYLLLAERRLHFHFRVRVRTPGCRAAADAFYQRHLSAFCLQTSVHFEDESARGLWDLADALFLPYERHAQDAEIPLAVIDAAAHGKPVFLLDRSPWADLGPHDLRARVTAAKDPDLGLRILDYVRDPGVIPGEVLKGHARQHFAADVAVRKLREIAERTAAR